MTKIKKVFLPLWQRKVVVPLLIIIWLFTTYEEFISPAAGDLGIVGYLVMTFVLLGVSIMIWQMTGGKLPAYVIREEDDSDQQNSSV